MRKSVQSSAKLPSESIAQRREILSTSVRVYGGKWRSVCRPIRPASCVCVCARAADQSVGKQRRERIRVQRKQAHDAKQKSTACVDYHHNGCLQVGGALLPSLPLLLLLLMQPEQSRQLAGRPCEQRLLLLLLLSRANGGVAGRLRGNSHTMGERVRDTRLLCAPLHIQIRPANCARAQQPDNWPPFNCALARQHTHRPAALLRSHSPRGARARARLPGRAVASVAGKQARRPVGSRVFSRSCSSETLRRVDALLEITESPARNATGRQRDRRTASRATKLSRCATTRTRDEKRDAARVTTMHMYGASTTVQRCA